MKWKTLIHRQNAKHFAWPPGWDTAETIAEQLECAPERVREHLAPSIRAGEVEVKSFTVWEPETGRKILRTGFRIAGKKPAAEPSEPSQPKPSRFQADRPDRWPFSEGARVFRLDYPNKIGTMRDGKLVWENGSAIIPRGNCVRKYRLAP